MAANPNVGAEGGSGAEGTPSQPVSQQPQPPIEGEVTKLLTDLGGKITNLEHQLRGLQGRQDRNENNVSSFQQQLARLNQYKAQGLSDTEALAEMEADDANDRWRQTLEQKIDSLASIIQRGGTQTNSQQMVTKALNDYGLDPKDPFVAGKLAGQNPANETEAELLAARIFRDQKSAPPTNPAQQSANPSGANNAGVDYNALSAEYDALAKGDISANYERMTEIQKELDKLK